MQIGPITLKHRIVMPPMSRLRAHWPSGVPSDLIIEYYGQRASDGGLIFTEATAISPSGRGYYGAPGLYSDEQVTGWKRITDAVHAKGGYIFAQLWHASRTTHIAVTGEEPVTASIDPAYWADPNILVVTPDGFSQPSPHRALETAEIADIVEQYRAAAVNAKRAGFDGIEVMAANGHLIDQFLQDNSNKRTDRPLWRLDRKPISNPDLPRRIEFGLPLNPYDRSTFYAFDGRGYTDYPAYDVRKLEETCVIEKIPLGTSSGEQELPPGPQRFKSRAGANG